MKLKTGTSDHIQSRDATSYNFNDSRQPVLCAVAEIPTYFLSAETQDKENIQPPPNKPTEWRVQVFCPENSVVKFWDNECSIEASYQQQQEKKKAHSHKAQVSSWNRCHTHTHA